MKVIIAGTRTFENFELLEQVCNSLLAGIPSVEIVTGDGRGADKCGNRYAIKNGFPLTLYPADWNKFGRSAGPKRNLQMGEVAQMLIAFWDGESPGTLDMITVATGRKLTVYVYRTDLNRLEKV
jgi:hypothetical protein